MEKNEMCLSPLQWEAPKWHSDFGEPKNELDNLRVFCLALLDRCPSIELSLNCYEEGYMCVDIASKNSKHGELYWFQDQEYIYGYFTDENEYKFKSLEEGVSLILNKIAGVKEQGKTRTVTI